MPVKGLGSKPLITVVPETQKTASVQVLPQFSPTRSLPFLRQNHPTPTPRCRWKASPKVHRPSAPGAEADPLWSKQSNPARLPGGTPKCAKTYLKANMCLVPQFALCGVMVCFACRLYLSLFASVPLDSSNQRPLMLLSEPKSHFPDHETPRFWLENLSMSHQKLPLFFTNKPMLLEWLVYLVYHSKQHLYLFKKKKKRTEPLEFSTIPPSPNGLVEERITGLPTSRELQGRRPPRSIGSWWGWWGGWAADCGMRVSLGKKESFLRWEFWKPFLKNTCFCFFLMW